MNTNKENNIIMIALPPLVFSKAEIKRNNIIFLDINIRLNDA